MEGIIFLFALLVQIGLAFIPASMAKKKGYSYGGFWCLSFFASFLVGVIVAACIADKTQFIRRDEVAGAAAQPQRSYHKFCSYCGAGLSNEDVFCGSCGAKIMQY